MDEKIINEDFRLTSILARGYYINYLIASLVQQFKDKNVLLWQDRDLYHSCKRIQLRYGVDLIALLEEFIDEFDVLIIDRFRDNTNVAESIDFIDRISQINKMRNKKVVIIFSVHTSKDLINIDDFYNLKYTIKTRSNNIYTFNRLDKGYGCDSKYQLQDLNSNQVVFLKETHKGINTGLEKISK